ncbi:fimbria A protein (plasmid) [Lelliottia sp. WB101]|jgi:type 1 fimbria pilin|uniref:fimbrial protein n=1 Tax=Lelliottia sp. WB101 TaxID=2153385 RepID=UPI000D212659|nr:fimbrial protein [Lelliottia sp. WB101]AVZ00434.1 fimbria A protein [Lelliottia sp. WB101]
MKFNKIVTALILASGMATFGANAAADGGSGRVDFRGSIIDAACSIDPDSSVIDVNLGQVASKQLAGQGSSTPVNFEINLKNCELDTSAGDGTRAANNTVSVTFGGSLADGDNTLLGITGDASGAGVAMTDASGKRITLGEATPARALIEGDNTLGFSAFLVGLKDQTPETGNFAATADFTLAYE